MAKQPRRFRCPHKHEVVILFAANATKLPDEWDCPQHGTTAVITSAPDAPQPRARARTHWDMLLERRTIAELEVLLNERLEMLRHGRVA
ncbi:RNA polymerase-binding protein RbpA [Allokutzneria sp. A3M-2-11 16]|nr:RNA polymerase-binding protein RbpA [Allokutzneria sp. A3M-2-11 16]